MPNLNDLTTVNECINQSKPYSYSSKAALNKTLKHYAHEYALSRVFMEHNRRINNANRIAGQEKYKILTVSQQRKIHKDFENELKKNPANANIFNTDTQLVNEPAYMNALYTVLKKYGLWNASAEKSDEAYTQEFNVYFQRYEYEFSRRTHIGETPTADSMATAYLPLSPLDSNFELRESFLDHGGQILYAQLEHMDGHPDKNHSKWQKAVKLGYFEGNGFEFLSHANDSNLIEQPLTECGNLLTQADIDGISFLLPYATTDEEKNSIKSAFSYQYLVSESEIFAKNAKKELGELANTPENKERREEIQRHLNFHNAQCYSRISPKAAEKAINLLNFLTENGYRYELSKDEKNHQIKAHILNTSFDVRLVDTTENRMTANGEYVDVLNYAGRVYNYRTRQTFYVNTTLNGSPRNESNKEKTQVKGNYESDNLELLPLCYALGITPPKGYSLTNNYVSADAKYLSYAAKDTGNLTVDLGPVHTTDGTSVPYKRYNLSVSNSKSQQQAIKDSKKIHDDSLANIPLSQSEQYFINAVASAKNNLQRELNISGLIDVANQNAVTTEDAYITPNFSQDEIISDTQNVYWEVLTGKTDNLIVPGHETDSDITPDHILQLGQNGIDTPADLVRAHADLLVEEMIGTVEKAEDGKRFNVSNVLHFMDNHYNNVYDNQDEFAERLGARKFNVAELRGTNESFNATMINRSVTFDETKCHNLIENIDSSEIMHNVYDGILNAITSVPNCFFDKNHLEDAIKIDTNGVVKYEFYRIVGRNNIAQGASVQSLIDNYETNQYNGDLEKVTGYVGQVFDYDTEAIKRGHPVVKTNFIGEGESNYCFVPTQTAYILPKTIETPGVGDRLRVNTYEKQMYEKIFNQVHADLFANVTNSDTIGKTYSINSLYHGMTGEHMPYDYYNTLIATGASPEDIDMCIKQQGNLFSLNSDIRDNANAFNAYAASETELSRGLDNDNVHSVLADFNYQDVGVISSELRGYVDPYITGNARNQGIHLYLVNGATLDLKTGQIHPAKNEDGTINIDAHCSLLDSPHFRHASYDAADRQIMASNNAMVAESIATHTGFVQMSFGGWGYDDGFIISQDYADRYPVYTVIEDEHGNPVKNEDGTIQRTARPRIIGDKISDFHGNKGVIATIVDRNKPITQQMYDDVLTKLSETTQLYNAKIEAYKEAILSVEKIDSNTSFESSQLELQYQQATTRFAQASSQLDELTAQMRHGVQIDTNEVSNLQSIINESSKAMEDLRQQLKDNSLPKLDALKTELDKLSAEKRDLHRQVNLYDMTVFMKNNPNIDVIESPYSHTSRLNGGTAMDGMEEPFDVIMNDGTIKKGCAGYSDFNNLPQRADVKTHIYEDDLHGRKASPQLSWALDSQEAFDIKDEFYGNNLKAFKDLRELSNALGGDIDSTSKMHIGIDTLFTEKTARHIFRMPVEEDIAIKDDEPLRVVKDKINALVTQFGENIDKQGGLLELPFPLEFEIRRTTKLDGEEKDVYEHSTPLVKSLLELYPDSWLASTGIDINGNDHYLLPIMSPKIRSGVELFDGERKVHDYTSYYMDIYRATLNYYNYKLQIDRGETWNGNPINQQGVVFDKTTHKPKASNLQRLMENEVETAQHALNKLKGRIISDYFDTKHNIAKEGLMSKRLAHSATAVWTADPYLPIDTIAMSPDMATQLGLMHVGKNGKLVLKKDAGVLIWRDPVLHDAGVRYYNVQLRPGITGIQINGAMDKNFDGDFDGDTIAVVALQTSASNKEGREKLSVGANLLDKNAAEKDVIVVDKNGQPIVNPTTNEPFTIKGLPILMNDGMDLAAGECINPSLIDKRNRLEFEINMVLKHHCTDAKQAIQHSAYIDASRKCKEDSKIIDTYKNLKIAKEKQYKNLYDAQKNNVAFNEFYKKYKSILDENGVDKMDKEALKALVKNKNEESGAWLEKAKACETSDMELAHWKSYFIKELSAYTSEAFEEGMGKHIISYESLTEHLKSVANYMNDGAKAHGKVDKLADYAKMFGFELATSDEAHEIISPEKGNTKVLVDNNKNISTDFYLKKLGEEMLAQNIGFNDITKTGYTEQDRLSQQGATNTKTQATGLAGAVSQAGMAGLRCKNPTAVLELTYAVTQAVLQAKHDAREAQRKFDYLQGIVRGVWAGKKIAKFDENGNRIPYDKVGEVSGTWRFDQTIRPFCSTSNPFAPDDFSARLQHNMQQKSPINAMNPIEFKEMFNAFYQDEEGLGLMPNQEYLDLVVDSLTQTNDADTQSTVVGIKGKKIINDMAIIDEIAYGYHYSYGKINAIFNNHDGQWLYGTHSQEAIQHFSPTQIRENRKAVSAIDSKSETYDKQCKAVVKEVMQSDIKADFVQKKDKSMATTAKAKPTQVSFGMA